MSSVSLIIVASGTAAEGKALITTSINLPFSRRRIVDCKKAGSTEFADNTVV